MEYFEISAKFVPLKYYTLSSQLRRLTSFSVGLFGSANSVTRSYPVMQKSCICQKKTLKMVAILKSKIGAKQTMTSNFPSAFIAILSIIIIDMLPFWAP